METTEAIVASSLNAGIIAAILGLFVN